MRARTFWPRNGAAWLGWLLLTGLGGALAAHAESDPCDCVTDRQSVVSEMPCLIIAAYSSCGASTVRNACDTPVTLVSWPLVGCADGLCDLELQPNEQASFHFADGRGRSSSMKWGVEERFEEETFTVSVDGEERDLVVSASVSCVTGKESPSGCASSPGGIALAGVLALLGGWRRARNR
ncbi:MXAN_0125 family MYXO-CTERM protein [Myxococcus eversor]|uniref:MXAN_0125 family MYXO-CTERM protein n=1 Tax=Myxococcus eversor TaxID=2709661 RepID=UPI001F077E18|nr:MXAN_0125 family MYXO-CTERM protein [Myxococcus eversor]